MSWKTIIGLAHSRWNCKYHLVFAPKYRRMQIYGQIRKHIRRLCEQKGVEIIEAELCPDHIHMLVSIPPKNSVASIMGYLREKVVWWIFDRHANLKYKYGNRLFWGQGYYVDTVGKNRKAITGRYSNRSNKYKRICKSIWKRRKGKRKIKKGLGALKW